MNNNETNKTIIEENKKPSPPLPLSKATYGLQKYRLPTDHKRSWERRSWKGNKLCIVKNGTDDLKISFVESRTESDMFG